MDFEECPLLALDQRLHEELATLGRLPLDRIHRDGFDLGIPRRNHVDLREFLHPVD